MATAIPSNRARFTLGQIAAMTGGRLQGPAGAVVDGVCTDTREELAGQLFVALRGANFDGHQYLRTALERGATGILAEELPPDANGVQVASTLDALGQLARAHRRSLETKVVAVAGSAGKTTTRSVTSALLRHQLGSAVHVTAGNLNNRIGVPMVMFGLRPEHQWAVLELGTNQTGEVAALADVCEPDIALLTLIDLEHTEGLGDIDAIEREESDVFHASASLLVGNADDERVMRVVAAKRAARSSLSYGFSEAADYRIVDYELTAQCRSVVRVRRPDATQLTFETPFIGTPGALACTAALLVGEHVAARPLTSVELQAAFDSPAARQHGRLEPRALHDGVLVIDDSYNANPVSVKAAIDLACSLRAVRGGRLHLVLGEMRELGPWSESEHRKLAPVVKSVGAASVAAIAGDAAQFLASGDATERFFQAAELVDEWLSPRLQPDDVVLVKASRGVRADLVVDALVRARGLAE